MKFIVGWKPVTQNYDNRISFSEWGKTLYMQLDKTFEDVRLGNMKIISRDLIAKVGSDN